MRWILAVPALLIATQGSPEVRIGKSKIPIRVRAKNGERGPATMTFGELKRDEGALVAFPRDRYAHFYHWSRGETQKAYDVAFITSKGEVVEIAMLNSEQMPDPRPAWGISKIKGITSSVEVQYALFLAPGAAGRMGIKKGAAAELDLGGASIEEMPSLDCGEKKIYLEILAVEPDRSRGLTYRPGLSKGEGMIFAYPDAKRRPFWMYHTYLSIDVSYVKSDGTLLEINPMPKMKNPDDEKTARDHLVPTKVEAHYVLETPMGWLKEAGFKVGDKFTLPKELTSVTPEKSPFE